jgi:hypothetical protein
MKLENMRSRRGFFILEGAMETDPEVYALLAFRFNPQAVCE